MRRSRPKLSLLESLGMAMQSVGLNCLCLFIPRRKSSKREPHLPQEDVSRFKNLTRQDSRKKFFVLVLFFYISKQQTLWFENSCLSWVCVLEKSGYMDPVFRRRRKNQLTSLNVFLSLSAACFLEKPSFTSTADIPRLTHGHEQDWQITAFALQPNPDVCSFQHGNF